MQKRGKTIQTEAAWKYLKATEAGKYEINIDFGGNINIYEIPRDYISTN